MIEILPSVGILDARAHLAELCGAVARSGQPVWLSRRGTPVVELRPLRSDGRSGDRLALPRREGILDLWRECRQRFGPVEDDLPEPGWIDPPRRS